MNLYLHIKLESDAAFGRGDGVAGLVDAEVEHDRDTGLPFVRGRVLKGLLVEACADILFALRRDGATLAALEEAAAFLYGQPGSTEARAACMQVGTGLLPEALRAAVAADVEAGLLDPQRVLGSLTTIRRQTAIDPDGVPAEGSLRSVRLVLRDTVFRAALHFMEPPPLAARALLAACASTVHRGGTSRNRGIGRLTLSLHDAGGRDVTAELLDSFETIVREGPPPGEHAAEEPARAPQAGRRHTGSGTRKILRYRLKLLQPVLIRSLDGDPNSAVGTDYLPGGTLRGALIGRYLKEHGDASDLAANPRARRLFFDGGIRFLNGYPVGGHRRSARMLPTPLSWHGVKGDEEFLFDFALVPEEELAKDRFAGLQEPPQWQRTGKPFAQVFENQVTLLRPHRVLNVHIQRARNLGSPGSERAVYRYDALAAGQIFEAALICEPDVDVNEVKRWLEGTLMLGGARSVDYGAAEIIEVHETEQWYESGADAPPLGDAEALIVTLYSDVMLRDKLGRYTTDVYVFTEALSRQLGMDTLVLKQAFVQETLVGGFNRKWGLPLPQARALAMGSVFVFEPPRCGPDALRRVEEEGLGLRRTEGFGRVGINRHECEKLCLSKHTRVRRERLAVGDDAVARHIAEKMVRRMLEDDLTLRLVQRTNELVRPATSTKNAWPSNSQLARVRGVVRNALSRDALSMDPVEERRQLLDFLDSLSGEARRQFERMRLDRSDLLQWLRQRIEDRDTIWREQLKVTELPSIGSDVRVMLSDEQAYHYNLRLVFNVLGAAAKLKEKEEVTS